MLVGSGLAQEPALWLPSIFGDHMVLQRHAQVPVFGTCAPGAEVQVRGSWDANPVVTVAGADGTFRAELSTAAGGPFTLTVTAGTARREITDVLLGEVWLGSGQSNMEWTLQQVGTSDAELAAAELPDLRLFTVERRWTDAPVRDLGGRWEVCTPATLRQFSAVAYFFGRELLQHVKSPVGMVVSSVGGTVCEAWTSEAGLREFPEFHGAIVQLRQRAGAGADAAAAQRQAFWSAVAAADPRQGDRRPESADFTLSAAPLVELPRRWSEQGLSAFDGVGWYCRDLEIPAGWAGRELALELGAIDDMDTVFFAGERIGGIELPGAWNRARRYKIPARLARVGKARLAIRVLDTGGEGGLGGAPEAMRLRPAGAAAESLALAGSWSFLRGKAIAELPELPAETGRNPNVPTVLWNAMVAPLVPFRFAGVIWYQGESNRDRHQQYARLFPAMIRDWRRAFGRELPFLFVQIAPFDYGEKGEETPLLRAAQAAALALPATGMVVTMDVGDPKDIHPRRKQPVGERLARHARAKVYGEQDLCCDGPRFAAAAGTRDGVAVRFTGADGGLRARTDPLVGFEVAGADQAFVPATAVIDGDRVHLRSTEVSQPAHVRYGWGAAVEPGLQNGAGLPAWPFRAAVEKQ
jgi:sialate O-acetylesterase